MKDIFVEDYEQDLFTTAFKRYFGEISTNTRNWSMLFSQMNAEKENTKTIMRLDGEAVVGFVMFCEITLKCIFFYERIGYVRELWVDARYRSMGNGRDLLEKAEMCFAENNIKKSVLSIVCGKEKFYEKCGYERSLSLISEDGRIYTKEIAVF